MFETFRSAFKKDGISPSGPVDRTSFPDKELSELVSAFGGSSFNRGIYRIGSAVSIGHWTALVSAAFPGFSDRIACFAHDWLGRVFALDSQRIEDGRPGVLMMEPGTGETLEIPCNLVSFHETELIQYREPALAENFYNQWLTAGGAVPGASECVAYRKPLFLGGSDTVDNLEISDFDVYWTISGQLIQRARGLAPGTRIGKITIE